MLRPRVGEDHEAIGGSRRRHWLIAVVGLAALAAACGGGGDDEGTPDPDGETEVIEPTFGGSVTMGVAAEPTGLLPTVDQWGPDAFNLARAVYDPLTVVGPDGIARPYLVESIEPNPDFTEWIITPRVGPTWHNGDPVTAEDIAAFIKGMQLSLLAGAAFDPVDAVIVVPQGTTQSGAECPAEQCVAVLLNTKWTTFPALLSGQPGYLVHPDMLDGTISKKEPVGSGPFRFDSWNEGRSVDFVRNDDYWRDPYPYLNEVSFTFMDNATTREAALQSGEVDLMHTNDPGQVIDVGRDGSSAADGIQVVFDGSSGDEMMVVLNTQTGVTSDLAVRRALALATDKQQLVDGVLEGFFEVADLPYPPGSTWYSDPGWPEPDLDEAGRLVSEWEAANGDLTLRLVIIAGEQANLQMAQALEQQWSDAGISVDIVSQEQTTFSTSLLVGQFEAILLPYFNRADPDSEYHFWDPERIGPPDELSLNFPRYTSDRMADNLKAARETDDVAERQAYYAEVWKDWAENFPYIFLYHQQWIIEADDSLQGLDTFSFPDGAPASPVDWGAIFLTDVWIE